MVLALGCVCALTVCQAGADVKVRPYPYPGYRLMGTASGGPGWVDYDPVHKMGLQDTFPNKKAWWADVKAREDAGTRDLFEIFSLYFGVGLGRNFEEGLTIETVKKRFDAWLAPEPGVPTYPELIPAVYPSEENVPAHGEILSQTARYVRETYGIPVFQWLTDRDGPDLHRRPFHARVIRSRSKTVSAKLSTSGTISASMRTYSRPM